MCLIQKEFVPKQVEMMEWTTKIYNQGIRRPGYPADYWAEKWVQRKFEAYGLQDVTLDPVLVKKWEVCDAKLKIWMG